jgi:Uma2 family endonuclease
MSLAQTKVEVSDFTYFHYKQWPDDERWELINGDAFAMSPAPTVIHQEVVGNLYQLLSKYSPKCKVFLSPIDVLLASENEGINEIDENLIDTIVQPDIIIVCDKNKIKENNIKGAPNFIVEVLSPSTAKRDEGIKRDLYQNSGVEEYWLVHPKDKTINRYQLINGIYEKSEVFGSNDTITSSCLEDITIELNDIFS